LILLHRFAQRQSSVARPRASGIGANISRRAVKRQTARFAGRSTATRLDPPSSIRLSSSKSTRLSSQDSDSSGGDGRPRSLPQRGYIH
jgi:hypothetical protein